MIGDSDAMILVHRVTPFGLLTFKRASYFLQY